MKEFTLSEDSLPLSFFDEIGFSFQEIAVECIKRKFTTLSHSECDVIFEKNYDLFSEKISELRDSENIMDYRIGEIEINERKGTWGYFLYKVDDVTNVRIELEQEAKLLFDKIVNDI